MTISLLTLPTSVLNVTLENKDNVMVDRIEEHLQGQSFDSKQAQWSKTNILRLEETPNLNKGPP
jgi:hypothetical protein